MKLSENDAAEMRLSSYLMHLPIEVQNLAQDLRSFIKEQTHPSMELAAPSTQSVNIGYGFTRKAWDCYVAIIVYSKHINLSFPSGAFLDDSENILVGTGRRIRHIRVDSIEEASQPEVLDLLQKARDYATSQLEQESRKTGTQLFVK
ncbi:MAG: hypothetical protein HKN32_06770 [Flavobacteriales bacterium]|nr:hypothetical protein [Flavobacteriales bacterium]